MTTRNGMQSPPKPISPMLPALSAGEVRAHLRTSGTKELSLIRSYILAAQHDIEVQCERALTVRRYRLVLPRFPKGRLPVHLDMCPVRSIVSVSYYDDANDLQSYADYVLMANEEPGCLYPETDGWWPSTYCRPDAIAIEFWAGHVAPVTLIEDEDSGSGDPEVTFTSTTGFEFEDDEEVVISMSGNTNSLLGELAALPSEITASTILYVVNSTGTTFGLATTVGGTALPVSTPTADCQAIDLLFAGELEPYHRLALLQMTAKAFGQRCPQGGCACSPEDYETDPVLRRLRWRSPVEFA